MKTLLEINSIAATTIYNLSKELNTALELAAAISIMQTMVAGIIVGAIKPAERTKGGYDA